MVIKSGAAHAAGNLELAGSIPAPAKPAVLAATSLTEPQGQRQGATEQARLAVVDGGRWSSRAPDGRR